VASPRITDGEILVVAAMRDVSEKVLRYIAYNRKYRQNHQVVVMLLNNLAPLWGLAEALGRANSHGRELKDLAKNRNIPTVVSRAAKQILDRRHQPQTQGRVMATDVLTTPFPGELNHAGPVHNI